MLGASFSVLAVTRHYDAVLFALPFGVAALFDFRRNLPYLIVAALAAAPLMAALLVYYDAITGYPLQTPMTLVDPWDQLLGANFTVTGATELAISRVIELAEWTSPAFVLIYGWALVRRARSGSLRFYETYPLMFLLGYWLYWGAGGNCWGPRYIYPSLPFAAMTVAAVFVDLLRQRATGAARWFPPLAVLALFSEVLQLPDLMVGAASTVAQMRDPYVQVERAGLHQAVVLMTTGSGEIWHLSFGNLARNLDGPDGDLVYAHPGKILEERADPAQESRAVTGLNRLFPRSSPMDIPSS